MLVNSLGLNATTMMANDRWLTLDFAREAGLKYVELAAGKGDRAMIHPEDDIAALRTVKQKLREAGLQINALGAHRDLTDQKALQEYLLLIEKAVELECPVITAGVPDGCQTDRFCEGLYAAACRGSELGVTVCLETHGYEHESGALLLPLLKEVPAAGICYDTGNVLFYSDATPEEDLPLCISKIRHLHLKDKSGGRGEWNFPPAGQGVVPFDELFSHTGWNEELSASIEIEFTPEGAEPDVIKEAVLKATKHLLNLPHFAEISR